MWAVLEGNLDRAKAKHAGKKVKQFGEAGDGPDFRPNSVANIPESFSYLLFGWLVSCFSRQLTM